MTTSNKGIELIKQFEGCKLESYQDIVGVWTCGFGHTGPDVFPGQTITEEEAVLLLQKDLEKFETGITHYVKVPLNQNQFDALVSFSYNLGLGSLSSSTLLKQLNAGNYAEAAKQFLLWNKAGGKVIIGLTHRRQSEANLFLS